MELNKKSSELYNISNYNIDKINVNEYTKSMLREKDIKSIDQLYDFYNQTIEEKNKFDAYFNDLQKPYENFLKYIYLPSLNIWKDPFSNVINPDII